MSRLKVVNRVGDTGRVYFGAWVTMEDEAGETYTYRVVGADEIDRGKTISVLIHPRESHYPEKR